MAYLDASEAPARATTGIKLHGPEGFAGMRKAGQLAAACLDMLSAHVKPGVTTAQLDKLALEFGKAHGAFPATIFYRGYSHSLCTSLNHVVCHGIPNDKPLKDGDIVNIDVTLLVDGWHGDTSRMFVAGKPNRLAERLIDVTYEAMMLGITEVKPGARLGDVGAAIQKHAEANRFSVVRDFCGHGLGKVFHDAPNVVHYGQRGTGVELKPGMFFTIEPMINAGDWRVKLLSDGWTAVTRDKSLSAQFEHCIGVTETGHEIFTLSPAGLHKPPYGA
ncbi:MAG: type I methionyl aminopeptidase [Rhizorhabdus sp.]